MKPTLLVAAACAALALAGCSSAPQSTPVAAPTTVEPAAASAPTTDERTPGQPIQVSMYVRTFNAANAAIGEPSVTEARALDFAASMCDALDTGASAFDANQMFVDSGYSPADAGEVVASGIAAACTEHLP